MIQTCEFETPIASSYLRNNRSTRQKSLRCFPVCDPRGHIGAGFCGLPLRVKIQLASTDDSEPEININSYLFIAETRPLSSPGLSSRAAISKQAVMQNIRTKSDKSSDKGELFIGDVTVINIKNGTLELLVVFNGQHASWDYAWRSNRWSGSQEQHVVDIVALKYSSLSDFIISSSFPSTPFIVASSHKRGPKPETGGGGGDASDEVLQASNLLSTLCETSDQAFMPLLLPVIICPESSRQRKGGQARSGKAGDHQSLTEGAETLMSLFSPLAPSSLDYPYDKPPRNKRQKTNESSVSSFSSSSSYPPLGYMPASYPPLGYTPAFGEVPGTHSTSSHRKGAGQLIVLPTRD
jgi:hypothetical protein